MDKSADFIHAIQVHERAWGSDPYPNRPNLQEMLSAKVVVFWKHAKEDRLRATLHDDLRDVETALAKMLLRLGIESPKRSVARIYVGGQRMCIQGLSVKFGECKE